MDMFKVHSVEEAKLKLIENLNEYSFETEKIEVINARGRILGEDVYANIDVPHFRRSTVDGFAVVAKDTFGASESMPVFLQIIGEVKMGHEVVREVVSDKAIYVPTGGMIPDGADAVVMVEYIERFDDNNMALYKSVVPKENIIGIGDDIQKGEKVLSRGGALRSQDLGVLSSIGIDKVKVFKMPKIAIISTGDEIVDSKEIANLGQIRDINTYTLSAMAESIGCIVNQRDVVRDDFNKLKDVLIKSIDNNDIVVISGGSSVGTKDMTSKVIEDLEDSNVFVHGVSIKPGKPTILGRVKGKPLFGLPGQPVSAMIVFKVFVEYFINKVMGREEVNSFIEAVSSVNIHSDQGKETYQMVSLEKNLEEYTAHPVYGKSGMITLMSRAKGYIKVPANKEGVKAGEKVKVYLF